MNEYELEVMSGNNQEHYENRLVMSYKDSDLSEWEARELLRLDPYTNASLFYSTHDGDVPIGTLLEVLIDYGKRIVELEGEIAKLKGE